MRTRLVPILACLAAGSLGLALCSTPAAAEPAGANTSYAAAGYVSAANGVTASVTVGGAIGALLAPVNSVLTQVVNPLGTALNALSGAMVGDVSSLTTGGASATASDSPVAAPSSYPTCGTAPWDDSNCYGPTTPGVSAAEISLAGGTVQGYAASDSTGSSARARLSGTVLTVLGIPIGNLGVSEASAGCDSTLKCTGLSTLAGMSLLGGVLQARTGSDGLLQVSVNNAAFINATALLLPTTLSAAGVLSATAQYIGGQLSLRIGMSLHTLLVALGIPDTLASLNATEALTSIVLTVGIGTRATTTATGGTAHGLDLTLGLSVSTTLSVLGLASVNLTFADIAGGNLLGLQLALATTTDVDPTKRIRLPDLI